MSAEALRFSSSAGRGALLATVLGSGVAFLDQTVVNVALPSIGRSLHAGLAGLQWTVDAYLLTLGALLLVGGSLGDRLGRRRVFLVGLVWFALASAACGLSRSIAMLSVARAVQGVGAALLVPGSLAILRDAFRPEDQARAIGAWSGLSGVSTAFGPLLGGWLVQAVSWRLVFLINLPIVLVAVWAARRWVPPSQGDASSAPLDWPGALAATTGLAGVVFALIEGHHLGWTSPPVLASAALGTASCAGFLVIESRSGAPMMPLGLFRSRQFAGANATTLAVYFALGGATFLLVLELQRGLGFTPLQSGAALTPITVLLLALSSSAGRLAQRVGYRLPMTVGPLVAAAGLLLLSLISPGDSYVRGVLPGVAVLGLGLALTVAPLTSAALAGIEARHAGIASGVNNAVARIAGLLAVALLPLLGGISGTEEQGEAAAFARALRFAAAFCAGGGVIASVMLRPRARAER